MPASKTPCPILIAILLTVVISGCKTKEQADPRTLPDLVRTAIVTPAQQGDRVCTGVVTARVQSDLGFRVLGEVTKRFVNVGQTVRAGQPLVRVDVTDYAHVVTMQRATVDIRAK
jgi:multidrug efflux pump subunit AcrA (membrane-fusion protein)